MTELRKTNKFAIVAIDAVVFTLKDGVLRVLLIEPKRANLEGKWALPGGMVMPKESVDKAVARHLAQKAGISKVYLEQLYTFGDVDRDPFGRVVSVAYLALIAPDKKITLKTTEAYDRVEWFPVNALPSLAYDHKNIIDKAVERLRAKLEYTNIIYGLLPAQFTMGQLQEAYETILGRKLDKRNFRKKIKALNLIKRVGQQKRGEPNRPAELFTFIERRPRIIGIL